MAQYVITSNNVTETADKIVISSTRGVKFMVKSTIFYDNRRQNQTVTLDRIYRNSRLVKTSENSYIPENQVQFVFMIKSTIFNESNVTNTSYKSQINCALNLPTLYSKFC